MIDLTTVDPASLQNGLELDTLIAEKWMGEKPCPHNHPMMRGYRVCAKAGCDLLIPKSYSTNPAHAGEARRKAEGWDLHTFNHPNSATVSCGIRVGDNVYLGWCKYRETANDHAEAEALATCRAIAKALTATETAEGQ